VEFEWNKSKASQNYSKHGISFSEAATVFDDPLASTFPDPDHSVNEHRYVTIGQSNMGKILMVSHTDRLNRTRIISARKATRHEKAAYEE